MRDATLTQEGLLSWASQAPQYPARGLPGISYFAGVIDPETVVHCLLFRDEGGTLRGILNYYDRDMPPWESKGNVNLYVHRNYKRLGIGRALWNEAVARWGVTFEGQRFSPEGVAFADAMERETR